MTNSQMRDLCNQLRDCFHSTEQFVQSIEFDAHNLRHIGVTLYATRTLDYLSGVITTLSRKEYTSIPVLTRAGLESFVWFLYIIRHENSPSVVCLHDLYQKNNVLNKATEELASIRGESVDEIQAWIERHKSNIEELSDVEAEYKKTCGSIFERFRSVNLEKYYRAVYALLSAESHSCLSAVEKGNLNTYDSCPSVQSCKYVNSRTLLCVQILLDLFENIPKQLDRFLELNRNKDIERIRVKTKRAESVCNQFVNVGS